MTHQEILKRFDAIVPGKSYVKWWTKGKGAIRLRFRDGQDVIFTYLAEDCWKIETLKMWELSKDGI